MGVGKMGQIIGKTGVGEMGVGKMGVLRQNISCLFVNLDRRSHYVKRPQFSISTNTIIDQRSFGLIRPNFQIKINCLSQTVKYFALVINSYIALKLSSLSQNKLFNPNC